MQIHLSTDQSGQVLLFVLITVVLLLMILFAIVLNLRVDIQEVQVEREYKRGYNVSEEVMLEIASSDYTTWKSDSSPTNCADPWTFNKRGYCKAGEGIDECCLVEGLGDDGNGAVITTRTVMDYIEGLNLGKDQTLEVNVVGARGALNLAWENAPAVSLLLSCRDVTGYYNVRMAVCRSGNCNQGGISGFESITDAQNNGPLDLNDGCDSIPGRNGDPIALRIRAIGADAQNIRVNGGSQLPAQMEEVHVIGFPAGLGSDIEEGLPAPEVYTRKMLNKRLPALFDYVLFVGEGDVFHN